MDDGCVDGEALDEAHSSAFTEERDDERPAPGTHDADLERREVDPRLCRL